MATECCEADRSGSVSSLTSARDLLAKTLAAKYRKPQVVRLGALDRMQGYDEGNRFDGPVSLDYTWIG